MNRKQIRTLKKKNHLNARNILDLIAHGLNISKQLFSPSEAPVIWCEQEVVTMFHSNRPLHPALWPFSDSPHYMNDSPSVKRGLLSSNLVYTALGFFKNRKRFWRHYLLVFLFFKNWNCTTHTSHVLINFLSLLLWFLRNIWNATN